MDDLTNNDAPIMGNCLSCQGLVRVPATAPTTSTVKCPHCGESFRLSEILNDAVPELQIVEEGVDDDGGQDEVAVKDADGKFVVANQLRQSSKKSRRGRRRRRSRRPEETEGMIPVPKPLVQDTELDALPEESNASQFAVTESEPRKSFDSRRASGSSRRSSSSDSSRSRTSSRPSNRTVRSGDNMAVEIFKVVLGGALAIPIAYLLVLWVFKQDPLDVAPKIVQTAPFLLPAEFRALEDEAKSGTSNEGSEDSDAEESEDSDKSLVEEMLDVGVGLPKPRRDPEKVGTTN